MIELQHITAGYGKAPVLRDLSLTLPDRAVTTILGTNGCGKSTLLKTIVRLLPLTSGSITVDARPHTAYAPDGLAKKIAYLPQTNTPPSMTVSQMVLHGRFAYLSFPRVYRDEDRAAAATAMQTLGIANLADRPLRELSGGMRQKAYLAMALAQGSPTILLDEPTTYLDAAQSLRLADTIRTLADTGHAMVLVLHDLPLAMKLSDTVAVLHNGQLLAHGTPEEILESGAIETAYSVKIHPIRTEYGTDYIVRL